MDKLLEDKFADIDLESLAKEALEAVQSNGLRFVKKRPVLHFHLDYGLREGLYTQEDINAAQKKYTSRKNKER